MMRKLQGAVQMIRNMLLRDGTPARYEAAEELAMAAAASITELDRTKARIFGLQAAIAAKDAHLMVIAGKSLCVDNVLSNVEIADLALALKPSDAELRKLVAKHVRSAQNEYFPFDYASKIERGEVEL